MKKTMLIAALAVGTMAFAGCQAKKSEAPATEAAAVAKAENTMTKATETVKTVGYTKAQYMEACEVAMTTTQCECYIDFYKSIGLEVTELGDSAKIQKAMTNMKPEKAMEMQKCM